MRRPPISAHAERAFGVLSNTTLGHYLGLRSLAPAAPARG